MTNRKTCPREPTTEMIDAACNVLYGGDGVRLELVEAWTAMWDAAPAEPAPLVHPISPELLAMAKRVANQVDTRTDEQIIADGVSFIMGPPAEPAPAKVYPANIPSEDGKALRDAAKRET